MLKVFLIYRINREILNNSERSDYMYTGFTAFIVAVLAVTLAEMGDKTQLLAMCFATRFNWKKVLMGVFLATILNHALAVAAGYFLREILSSYTDIIQLIASLSFIGFGLWTIRGDSVDECADARSRFGPVITVAIAFFIAEMGDKTQLATISLAATLGNPAAVLLGTTTGMLIADGVGIVFGIVMHKRIPENKLKWISGGIFALCGLLGYVESLHGMEAHLSIIFGTTLLVLLITVLLAMYILKSSPNKETLKEAAVTVEKNMSNK